MKENPTSKKDDIDLLRNNYLEMDETGRAKLKEVSKKLSEIRKITSDNKENTEVKTV